MIPYEALALGTVIDGKYRVERLIGAGGMGAVYSASQLALGRKVAVKVLHPTLCNDRNLTARFHREASLAASIGHDNICEVTDFGIDPNGMPYLVMPLLKGTSLRAVLNEGPLQTVRLCDIMRQVLSALDAAHIAGVVHRDLKPDNIFVAQVGDRRDFVKLLDFGISKVLESEPVKELTQTGTLLGTADYMSPEQARGDKNVDHRLDIYAAGVILYEALTGKRPYDGSSYSEILLKIVTESCPPPRSVNAEISNEMEAVIQKAMARNPADRFVGAKEMSEAIAAAVQAIQSRRTPPSVPVTVQEASPKIDPAKLVSSEIGRPEIVSSITAAPTATPRTKHKIAAIVAVLFAVGGALLWSLVRTEEPIVSGAAGDTPPTIGAAALPASDASLSVSPAQAMRPAPSAPPTPENLTPAPILEPTSEPMPEPAAKKGPSTPKPTTEPPAAAASKKKPATEAPSKSKPEPVPLPPPVPLPSSPTSVPLPAPVPLPEEVPLPPPVPLPSSPPVQVYNTMNQLKTALREGRITRVEYKTHQTEIRKRRAAEYERLKDEYRTGAVTKNEYEQKMAAVRQKYEGE